MSICTYLLSENLQIFTVYLLFFNLSFKNREYYGIVHILSKGGNANEQMG